jgi:hypothetical protein
MTTGDHHSIRPQEPESNQGKQEPGQKKQIKHSNQDHFLDLPDRSENEDG